jgi:ribosome-associated heat shock protein Hsp15
MCDAGRIRVNGQAAKASKEIKPGDEIEVRRGERRTTVRVLEVPRSKQVSKTAAIQLFETMSDVRPEDTLLTQDLPNGRLI